MSKSIRVLAGIAVTTLAAAGVAAAVSYRQGRRLDPERRAQLEELDARLEMAEASSTETEPGRIGRILEALQRSRGVSVPRLRSWINGLRRGTLSPEQATVAESDFGALERDADQGGV